jgi:hypothetical protein
MPPRPSISWMEYAPMRVPGASSWERTNDEAAEPKALAKNSSA